MLSRITEMLGWLMLMVGIGGMDTEGDMWYLAAAILILGLILVYTGDRINRAYKRRRWEYDGSRTISKRSNKNRKRTML